MFYAVFLFRSWGDNLALTSDRVLEYRTGRVGVCLIAAMVYISLVSVDLFVPDWSKEDKAEANATLAKDIYYNDDDEVNKTDANWTRNTRSVSQTRLNPFLAYFGDKRSCFLIPWFFGKRVQTLA